MSEDKEKQKALGTLIERILWRMKLADEILNVYGFYFKNTDMFNRDRPITKAAINSTVSFLNSIKPLEPLWNASPIDKTGGIILIKDDDTPNNIIITERGTMLTAQADIKKYMDSNKI